VSIKLTEEEWKRYNQRFQVLIEEIREPAGVVRYRTRTGSKTYSRPRQGYQIFRPHWVENFKKFNDWVETCGGCKKPFQDGDRAILVSGMLENEIKRRVLARFCRRGCFIRFLYEDSEVDRERRIREIQEEIDEKVRAYRAELEKEYAPRINSAQGVRLKFCGACGETIYKGGERVKDVRRCDACIVGKRSMGQRRYCTICGEAYESGGNPKLVTCPEHTDRQVPEANKIARHYGFYTGVFLTAGGLQAAVRSIGMVEGTAILEGSINTVGSMQWDAQGIALSGDASHNLVASSLRE
jgi:hypothetical protein